MSEKFDIPFKSDMVPKILDDDTKIQFRCHKGISCFNACCKNADITLTPYDVLRLKKRLGLTSGEFLKQHTVPFEMETRCRASRCGPTTPAPACSSPRKGAASTKTAQRLVVTIRWAIWR